MHVLNEQHSSISNGSGGGGGGGGSGGWRVKSVPRPVLEYVEYMTTLLLGCPQRLSGETVALVLYGVQGLGSEEEAVRRLLHVVCHKLERHRGRSAFTPMELSQCLYGLRSMSQQDVEVSRLLRVLASEADLVSEVKESRGQQSRSEGGFVLLFSVF
jgi:hypothetical protein